MKRAKSLFFSRVFLKQEGGIREYSVESFRSHKNFTIIKLKGVDTLAQAKEYVGKECLLPEKDLSRLEQGSYYLFQIVGCSVVTVKGIKVGTVKDLLLVKDNQILEVVKQEREILIPFTEEICIEVNLKKMEIVIDPPEGLLEINEI